MKLKRYKKMFSNFADESIDYLSESKTYIYYSILFFFLSVVFGFIFSAQLGFLDNILRGILDKTQGMNGLELTIFIFLNNLGVSFTVIFLGIVLGIFPFVNSLANGTVLGYVLSKVYQVSGFADFWRILPHGIFELPALFISVGLGIKLGFSFFSRNPLDVLKHRFTSSMKVFIFIIIPLLVIAAIIEGLLISFLG